VLEVVALEVATMFMILVLLEQQILEVVEAEAPAGTLGLTAMVVRQVALES
jgi:hypothetical protein